MKQGVTLWSPWVRGSQSQISHNKFKNFQPGYPLVANDCHSSCASCYAWLAYYSTVPHHSLSPRHMSLEVLDHNLNHHIPASTTEMYMRCIELAVPSFIASIEEGSANRTLSHTSPQPHDQQCEHNDHSQTNQRLSPINQSTPSNSNSIVITSISLSTIPCAFEPGSVPCSSL